MDELSRTFQRLRVFYAIRLQCSVRRQNNWYIITVRSKPIFLRPILYLSCHKRLGSPRGPFSRRFRIKIFFRVCRVARFSYPWSRQ